MFNILLRALQMEFFLLFYLFACTTNGLISVPKTQEWKFIYVPDPTCTYAYVVSLALSFYWLYDRPPSDDEV